MGERVFINDLNPISDIVADSKILIDQGGYKKMVYSDFVVDIVGTIKSDYNDSWNAQMLDGTTVGVDAPQDGEVIVYNNTKSQFENKHLEAKYIAWSNIDTNEYKFLHVNSDGVIEQKNIEVPSLRIDNNYSDGFFLRVKKDGTKQLEAVDFQNNLDSGEFFINAQTLEGNDISDLDTRYMRGLNNLSELTDVSASRTQLQVLSETEGDNRYLSQEQNLNDVNNTLTSFDNIKQPSTTSYAGVIEIATSPEVQDGLRNDVAVVPSTLSENYYNKSVSNSRYLQSSNNLSDLNDYNSARLTLNVYSKTETDSRYLQKGLNLSELTSKEVARDNLEVYDKSYIDGILSGINGVPTGTVISFPSSSVPDGFIKCNGATLPESTYPELFLIIGRTYGGSSVSSTFSVPDLRGEFIRGWDDGRNVDSGRAIGSYQSDMLGSHNHSGSTNAAGNHRHGVPTADVDANNSYGKFDPATTGSKPDTYTSYAGNHSHSLSINYSGGSETRPRNIAMMYCIKY